jgi:hypothetical protein
LGWRCNAPELGNTGLEPRGLLKLCQA